MKIAALQAKLRQFAVERDWEQFHTPKNLAASISVEAAELLEIFQWLNDEQSKNISQNPAELRRVEEELADIFLYLIRLADRLNIDLSEAAAKKLISNAEKYPVEASKSNAIKYNRRS